MHNFFFSIMIFGVDMHMCGRYGMMCVCVCVLCGVCVGLEFRHTSGSVLSGLTLLGSSWACSHQKKGI